MKRYEVFTDFNGLVIFEPSRLLLHFDGEIPEGTDLFEQFTTSELGDTVLRDGLVVPILAIDDAGYAVEFYVNESSRRRQSLIRFENGVFPLKVDERLVLADLAVFKEWMCGVGWIDVDVPPGNYAATVRGFVERCSHGEIVDAGYEILLDSVEELPEVSGDTGLDSRVLCD